MSMQMLARVKEMEAQLLINEARIYEIEKTLEKLKAQLAAPRKIRSEQRTATAPTIP